MTGRRSLTSLAIASLALTVSACATAFEEPRNTVDLATGAYTSTRRPMQPAQEIPCQGTAATAIWHGAPTQTCPCRRARRSSWPALAVPVRRPVARRHAAPGHAGRRDL